MEYQCDHKLFPPASSSSSLTTLRLSRVDMSGHLLSTIIRIPRAHQSLSLSQGGLRTFDGGITAYVPPKKLGKALLEHKSTLQVLDLDVGASVESIPRYKFEYEDRELRDAFVAPDPDDANANADDDDDDSEAPGYLSWLYDEETRNPWY